MLKVGLLNGWHSREEPRASFALNHDWGSWGVVTWGVVNICIYVHACVCFADVVHQNFPWVSSQPDILISPVISTATIYVNVFWFNIAIALPHCLY